MPVVSGTLYCGVIIPQGKVEKVGKYNTKLVEAVIKFLAEIDWYDEVEVAFVENEKGERALLFRPHHHKGDGWYAVAPMVEKESDEE